MRRWVHPAWKRLGIEPTGDARAIRTAYSTLLKAIDPETDPQAFIELRDAFEAAKIQAQWVGEAEEDEDDAPWDEEDGDSGDLYQIRPTGEVPPPPPSDPAWETPAPPEPAEPADSYWQGVTRPAQPDRPSPWAPVSPEDADAHSRALATLLYSQDRQASPWPTGAQEDEMLAHWRAVTADPRMQELSYFADAERWFSELIARTAAFSDPLVIPATEYFGWLAGDGTITQTPAIAYLTRRYRMLEFQQSVKQPKHPLNPAWRELVRPAGPRPRRGSVNGRKVRQLLGIVRAHYPDLEGCFDPYRVALWDGSHIGTGGSTGGSGGGLSWGWVGPALFLGFLVLRFAMSAGGSSSYTPPPVDRQFVVPEGNTYVPPVRVPPTVQPGQAPQPALFPPTYTAPPRPLYLGGELERSDADLDQALEQLYGDSLDIATIAMRDPRLYRALQDFWASEKAAGVRKGKFAEDLGDFLNRRYPSGIRNGNPRLFSR